MVNGQMVNEMGDGRWKKDWTMCFAQSFYLIIT